jgi:hypothetical protein
MQYLGRHHPERIDAYAKLYQNGSHITRSYATPGTTIVGAAG